MKMTEQQIITELNHYINLCYNLNQVELTNENEERICKELRLQEARAEIFGQILGYSRHSVHIMILRNTQIKI